MSTNDQTLNAESPSPVERAILLDVAYVRARGVGRCPCCASVTRCVHSRRALRMRLSDSGPCCETCGEPWDLASEHVCRDRRWVPVGSVEL